MTTFPIEYLKKKQPMQENALPLLPIIMENY
jgi:hypothetical protein